MAATASAYEAAGDRGGEIGIARLLPNPKGTIDEKMATDAGTAPAPRPGPPRHGAPVRRWAMGAEERVTTGKADSPDGLACVGLWIDMKLPFKPFTVYTSLVERGKKHFVHIPSFRA